MAYESASVTVGVAAPAGPRRPVNADLFYGAVSLLVVLLVFVGFAPTFYLRSLFNGPPVPPLNVIHGLLATAWIVIVPIQAFLIRTRRKTLHRYLGWTNVGLAAAIVSLTPVVMMRFIPRSLAAFGQAAQVPIAQIFISDLIALPVFAGMLTAAIRNRHRPVAHRRWIIYASLMLATPAPGRAGFMLGVGLTGIAVIPAFVIACAIFDRRTLGALHPSTKVALVATIGHALVPLVLSAFDPVVQLVLSFA